MNYKSWKLCKWQIVQNDQTDRSDQTDLGDQTTHSHWIQCEMGGGKTVKHEKLPIPSFDQSVCEWRPSVQEVLAHLKSKPLISLSFSGLKPLVYPSNKHTKNNSTPLSHFLTHTCIQLRSIGVSLESCMDRALPSGEFKSESEIDYCLFGFF